MKNLIIIAAGGCGREVLQWAKDINSVCPRWKIKGFLDDDLKALDDVVCDVKILAKIDDYVIESDDEFACCIGNSDIRKKVIERLQKKGAKFVNIIHPTAVLSESCKLGEGIILYPFSIISDNAVLGDGCIINMYSSIAHDAVLGEYCTISAHCDVTGMCKVGNSVFMGSGANMVPGVKIGDRVFVCAGSTVMSNLKDDVKVLGIPARKVGF